MKVRNRILLLSSLLFFVSIGGIGNLMWQMPRIEQTQDLNAVFHVLILLGLFGAGLIFSVLELVRQEIMSPIFQLAAQVARLKERKIDAHRLELTGSKDIDLLTRAFNNLLDGLEKEGSLYRIFAEASPDIIFLLDRDGRVLFGNLNAARQWNYRPEEIIGKRQEELFPPDIAERHKQVIQKIFETGLPVFVEFYEKISERHCWVDARMVPILDEVGHVTAVLGISRDITERKRAEEALRIKDFALATSIDGIAISDLAGNLNYVNDAFLKLWGYDNKQEVIGKSHWMFSEDPAQAQVVVDALQRKEQWSGELNGKKKNGSVISVQLSANMITDSAGNALGMMTSFLDITESKRAEKTILELSKFPSENPSPVLRIAKDGKILYSNKPGLELLANWNVKIGEKAPEKWCRLVKEALESARPELQEEVEVKDKIFSVVISSVIESGYVNLYTRDITERKRMEERLEQINRCLLSFGSDFNANINRITALCGELLDGTCSLYNRLEGGLLCALGQWHTPQDFQPKDIPEGHICYDVIGGIAGDFLFVPDLLHTRYAETDINVRRYGLQSYLGHAVRCGSKVVGSLCVVFQHLFYPTESDKQLMGIMASAISAEENRHETEQKSTMLSDAIETAHHGCLIISADYKVIFSNHYALTKLGFNSAELKNFDLFSLCADREQVNDIIETMKVTRRWMGEIMVTKKDGKQFPALVSVTTFGADDDASGRGGDVILFQDITIQKEMRERLLASERLAVMGRLMADVAHELNNPLAIVIGGTQLVLSRIDEKPSPFKSQLETILRNARRCKIILGNLLGYGRTVGKKEEAVNLPNLIREAIDDVNYQHDMSAIETVLNYPVFVKGSAGASSEQAVAEINGNRSALLSVFVNLIRNARQAMGEKGRLTVTIEKEDAKHLRIEIHDTGSGISKEQKGKLFKPFTSGWKEGESSGLGLATSLGIIETHGGSMSAESEGVGKGATFTILLPCEFKRKKG